jgi:hypothetical protein
MTNFKKKIVTLTRDDKACMRESTDVQFDARPLAAKALTSVR